MGKVDKHGRMKSRTIVVREDVYGPEGMIGSNEVANVTEDIREIIDILEEGEREYPARVGEARGRLRGLLDRTR